MEKFQIFCNVITAVTDTQSQMTVMLLKDISFLLSFIVATREANINHFLQYERQFLKLTHAFDHISDTRWGTYHRVY